jgi:hypothetical protein
MFSDDPDRVRLAQLGFRLRERFLYECDFYDGWEHDIRLEKVLPLNPKRVFPVCTGGRSRCRLRIAEGFGPLGRKRIPVGGHGGKPYREKT